MDKDSIRRSIPEVMNIEPLRIENMPLDEVAPIEAESPERVPSGNLEVDASYELFPQLSAHSRPKKDSCKIIKESFGIYKKRDSLVEKTDEPQELAESMVYRYSLCNPNEVMVQVITFGATITSVKLPDKKGKITDVLLGFDTCEEYISRKKNPMSLGATFGRFSNIIVDASLNISHGEHLLSTNFGQHHYRGGFTGFDQMVWESAVVGDKVIMTCLSQDKEEGYPGQLMVQVAFRLTRDNTLVINTTATTSEPTILGLGHNLYFNLAGHATGAEGMRDHAILVNADKVVIDDRKTKIPTGELMDVGATYYDLRVPRPLGKAIVRAPFGGYDTTFCLTKGLPKQSVSFACRLVHPDTGRFLEIVTDMPGLRVETGTRLPDPNMRPPMEGDSAGVPDDLFPFFCRQTQEEDEYYKKLQERVASKQMWPRPASLPSEEHFFPRFAELESTGEEGEGEDVAKEGQGDEDRSAAGPEAPSAVPQDSEEGIPEDEEAKGEGGLEEEQDQIRKTPFLKDEAEDSSSLEDDDGEWKPPKPIEGKQGARYKIYGAVCLMPEEYPDPMNHKYFPKPVLRPGETYSRTIKYKFGVVPQRKEPDLAIFM